jgi:hypothetical protein
MLHCRLLQATRSPDRIGSFQFSVCKGTRSNTAAICTRELESEQQIRQIVWTLKRCLLWLNLSAETVHSWPKFVTVER